MAGFENPGAIQADWKRIRDVFERALDVEPSERSTFFAETCGEDATLRREVEWLLEEHEHAGGFLSVPTDDGLHGAETVEKLGPGTLVDSKYRIEEMLGAGGMGAVYRARHLRLEREVALKVVRGELVADPSAAERFRREAVAVARLRHPNIVTVHDYGVAVGTGAYLVMELLEGRSLHRELAVRGRLDVDEALGLMRQVCEAVGAANRAGVIHRDLKPENIFLETRDDAVAVKVVDFGLAKLEEAGRSAGGRLTMRGTVLGTPAYLSPEQCRGEEADARSDVYALGCVLFEMLAGRPPFLGDNVWALVYRHVTEEPPRPGELVPDLPPLVEEALVRALAKAPDDRHQTAEAFAEALGVRVPSGSYTTANSGSVAREPAAKRPPDNLPHAVTRFVGREHEIDDLRRWLARARLVTLVGPGGIGKTRLALETAARVLDEYADGVWFVELASLADPALVARTIGAALGVREPQPGRPEAESVEAWLREKRVLLVLDNCEHLVAACAALVERLLGACAGLHVLATSRESLAVTGEAAWQVPALGMPAVPPDSATADLDTLLSSEAVRLFVDRASLVRPGFAVAATAASAVAELCRRLEGVPLAIELAAARVKALSVEQLLEKLDDRLRLLTGGSRTAPTRQQALQATLDWSYDLLTEEERALFRLLSVFAGGWTLEAAEAIADAPDSVFEVLTRLVDKSLVTVHERRATVRYGMLEMVREYATGLLERSGEADAVRRAHAEFFTAMAEESRREFGGVRSIEWLARSDAEHDNVRAALVWLLEHDSDACLDLAGTLSTYRELRGYLTESRRCLETALARSQTAPPRVRAKGYIAVGMAATAQGDVAAARGFFEKGLGHAKEASNAEQIGSATFCLGAIAHMEGDLRASTELMEESLAIGRELGHSILVRLSINGLGEVARVEGDVPRARALYEQAVAESRRANDDHFLIVALCNLGAVECDAAEVNAAGACYAEALRTAQSLGITELVSLALDGMAAVAARRGSCERAGRLAGAARALLEPIGAALSPADREFRERYLNIVRELAGEATLDAAMAEGRAMTQEQAVELALSA